jgi:micrococcal nuclease
MLPGLLQWAVPLVLLGTVAFAGMPPERLPGPIAATVIEVVDGDTVVVRARIWLDQSLEIRVRLLGIDTPERRGRCPEERAGAAAAERLVRDLTLGRKVQLRDIRHDKYGGRVLARVELTDGTDLGEILIGHRLARTYAGDARFSWCS